VSDGHLTANISLKPPPGNHTDAVLLRISAARHEKSVIHKRLKQLEA